MCTLVVVTHLYGKYMLALVSHLYDTCTLVIVTRLSDMLTLVLVTRRSDTLTCTLVVATRLSDTFTLVVVTRLSDTCTLILWLLACLKCVLYSWLLACLTHVRYSWLLACLTHVCTVPCTNNDLWKFLFHFRLQTLTTPADKFARNSVPFVQTARLNFIYSQGKIDFLGFVRNIWEKKNTGFLKKQNCWCKPEKSRKMLQVKGFFCFLLLFLSRRIYL